MDNGIRASSSSSHRERHAIPIWSRRVDAPVNSSSCRRALNRPCNGGGTDFQCNLLVSIGGRHSIHPENEELRIWIFKPADGLSPIVAHLFRLLKIEASSRAARILQSPKAVTNKRSSQSCFSIDSVSIFGPLNFETATIQKSIKFSEKPPNKPFRFQLLNVSKIPRSSKQNHCCSVFVEDCLRRCRKPHPEAHHCLLAHSSRALPIGGGDNGLAPYRHSPPYCQAIPALRKDAITLMGLHAEWKAEINFAK